MAPLLEAAAPTLLEGNEAWLTGAAAASVDGIAATVTEGGLEGVTFLRFTGDTGVDIFAFSGEVAVTRAGGGGAAVIVAGAVLSQRTAGVVPATTAGIGGTAGATVWGAAGTGGGLTTNAGARATPTRESVKFVAGVFETALGATIIDGAVEALAGAALATGNAFRAGKDTFEGIEGMLAGCSPDTSTSSAAGAFPGAHDGFSETKAAGAVALKSGLPTDTVSGLAADVAGTPEQGAGLDSAFAIARAAKGRKPNAAAPLRVSSEANAAFSIGNDAAATAATVADLLRGVGTVTFEAGGMASGRGLAAAISST